MQLKSKMIFTFSSYSRTNLHINRFLILPHFHHKHFRSPSADNCTLNDFGDIVEVMSQVTMHRHGLLNNPDVRLPFHVKIWRGRLFHFRINQNWKELFQYFFLYLKVNLFGFTSDTQCFQNLMIQGVKLGCPLACPQKGQNRFSFK